MEASEIRDRESLRAWLEALPQGTEAERAESQRWAVAIAHRAAMRVLPVYWEAGVAAARSETGFNCLLGIWSLVITDLVSNKSEVDLKNAAYNALARGSSAHTVGTISQTLSAHLAQPIATKYISQSVVSALTFAMAEKREASSDVFSATSIDCNLLQNQYGLFDRPLWQEKNPLRKLWADIRPKILAQGADWQFWVDWYENALHGRPQDYDLLTKIALIDPEDWDKGADHVNALIADIRLKHIAETRPLGEDAIDKGADGLWHRVGRSDIDRDILQDALDSVRDEIRSLRAKLQGPQGNMFTALIADLDILDERIARYPDRPLRLHDTFLRVQVHVARNLECGELPDDDAVRDLGATLGAAALDMHNACGKTKSVVAARMAARFAEVDERACNDLRQITKAAATVSDDDLGAEFREDVRVATEPGAPEAEKKPALYRLTTRLSVILTRDGKNLVDSLKFIGGIGGGVTTLGAIYYAVLKFIF